MRISGPCNNLFLTISKKRVGILLIGPGGWIDQLDPDLIKMRPKEKYFPIEFHAFLDIENNSNQLEYYFEADTVRLLPSHPLYEQALRCQE